MAADRSIIKAQTAVASAFEYKPREISLGVSDVAKGYVADEAYRSTDFKIADLIAKQSGISQLESDAHQDLINSQVLDRLKDVEERAYKEGYDLGMADGAEKAFQDSKADLLAKMTALESILKRIEEIKTRMVVENEADLIRLVYLTAKKMALRDLEENREVVLSILQNVTSEFQADQKVVVQLAQADLDFLNAAQEKSGQKLEALQRVKFTVNENIKPGGCLIETEYGSVDATVDERVERTWQTLAERIPRNTPENP